MNKCNLFSRYCFFDFKMNMIIKYAVLIFSLFTFYVCAEEAEDVPALPPLDTAYEGIHPFALIHKNSTIYAYKLSGYEKPHNSQILYKLSVSDLPLIQLVRDADFITIKPSKFNVQRLLRGEEFTVKAEVFNGDYRNDGFSVYTDVNINFDELLYAREMTDLAESSRKQEYEAVSYNKKRDRFYIHKVQTAPSYEQVLHVDVIAGCLANFTTSAAVPEENELLYKFINCGTITPLYFNTNIK